MTISLASIEILGRLNLSTVQMAGVFKVLAVELAPLEKTRALAAERQARYKAANPVRLTLSEQRQGNVIFAPPCVEDKTLSSLLNQTVRKEEPPVSPPSKPLPSDEPEGFAEFMAVFPKRQGTADRKGAAKAFRAALKRADLQTLVDGGRDYAAAMKASNKLGTEFVKQARSWLNGDLWTEYQPKTNGAACPTLKYVKENTPAWDAWVDDYKRRKQKGPPRDFNGGWYFPTEYPAA